MQQRKGAPCPEPTRNRDVVVKPEPEDELMRVLAMATVLILSSTLAPSFAQQPGDAPAPSQPQTVPVQPERSPQQSEQSREQDQKRGEDVRVGRDWRTRERGDRDDRAMGGRDRDDRTVGRNSRMDRDSDWDRGDRDWDRRHYHRDREDDFDEDRGRRRVKICVEYENGDEYCQNRRSR
jgi:hypothetical protein